MRISHKHKLIGVSIPKCGSHSMFKLMEENFDGKSHGSFHEVIVPDNCIGYTAFAFVRNPYDRAALIYNMLSDPGNGSDFMRLVNHEFYKQEVEDLEFETFCSWLGNCPEESMVYEASTSQYDHLYNTNISNIRPIKMEDNPLNNLNKILFDNNLPAIYKLDKENEDEHKSWEDLANAQCIKLINGWAHKDFITYGYDR